MTSKLHSEPTVVLPDKNHSPGQAARITRGAQIASKSNQITRIDDTTYTVSSKVYEVIQTESGWVCSCPVVCCKHAHVIEISKRMREAVQEEVPKTIIKQVDLTKYKRCKSPNVVKQGIRRLKRGPVQGYKCKDCNKRFTHNLGFEKKHVAPEQITQAVDLLFSGLSSRKVAKSLEMTGFKISCKTVQNWGKEYAEIMERFADTIKPQVGEAWRTDELYLKIKGNRKYLFAMLDSETRF